MEPTKLRKALPWIGTHLLALAAGVWLFRPDAADSAAGNVEAEAVAATLEEQGAGPAERSGTGRPRTPREASAAGVHRLAWKSLAYEGLDRQERLKASGLILREWVKEDWQAALDTVMKETPDDYELLLHFDEVFRRDAGEVWSLIESKRYGVSSQSLKARWLVRISSLDETQRREAMEGLPAEAREAIEKREKQG
ncbi:hypothetical protein [Luteolibacter sp. Populi]|uniref:hypothetical protein n=1 Tax=Luteolibacter sp. Populi TaxID=3230487 RepID=UPI0034677169